MINILKKLSFYIPKKSKYLYYDKNSLQIQRFLKIKDYSVIDTRFNDFNIFILLKTIFDFKNIKFYRNNDFYLIYICKYIEYINPICVINFIDNDLRFYQIKNILSKVKLISIQNGWRTEINDIFSKFNKLENQKLSCDYYFVFNRYIQKKLSKFINSKYLVFGSLKNNFYKINHANKKKKILYISQFRSNREKIKYKKKFIKPQKWIIDKERKLLNNILNFCNSNKINFEILSNYEKRNINFKKELNYYRNLILAKNWIIIPNIRNHSNKNNYFLIDSYEICVTMFSTLGFESFARNNKVAFFQQDNFFNLNDRNFGWPYTLPSKGNFYSNIVNYKEVSRILKYLLRINKSLWMYEANKYKKFLLIRNNNIELLMNIINNQKPN